MKRIRFLFVLVVAHSLNVNAQKTWAQHERYATQNDSVIENCELGKTRRIKAVLMGNSIADQWAKLHPSFFSENNLVGRGISGQVTAQMLCRFQADVIALRPKMVVIMAGTNDIAQNNGYVSHEHILQNIQSMCELARRHKIRPVLCSCLPASAFKWRPEMRPAEEIQRLNAMIESYAKSEKIQYIDYYSHLADEQGGLPKRYANDGVHPNLDGYAVMEQILLKNL